MFDTNTVYHIILASLAGGVIGLDRTAAGQFMFSQPIVAGSLIGWLLGDLTTGLVIGAVLELIWVMDMPVGTFVPADSTIATVFATAAAILGTRGAMQTSHIGFSILLTTVLAPVTMTADDLIRKWNSRLADFAASGQGDGRGGRLTAAHLSGLAVFFFKSFALYLIFIPAGLAAVHWFSGAPDALHRAMSLFLKLLPMLGLALIARKLSLKTLDRFFIIGFLAAAALGFLFHAHFIIITLVAAAAGWLGARLT